MKFIIDPVQSGAGSCLTEPSARAEMTFPNDDKDLLIIFASSRTVPSAPVLPTFESQTQ